MDVRNRNIMELIFQSAVVIILFFVNMFDFWSDYTFVGAIDVLDNFGYDEPLPFFYLTVVVTVIGLILAIIQVLSSRGSQSGYNPQNMGIYALLICPAQAILFIVSCLTYDDDLDDINETVFGILIGIYSFLALIALFSYIPGKIQGIKEQKPFFSSTVVVNDTQPAEVSKSQPAVAIDPSAALINYKKLLDEGIITQQEFDKKKAELLKL